MQTLVWIGLGGMSSRWVVGDFLDSILMSMSVVACCRPTIILEYT